MTSSRPQNARTCSTAKPATPVALASARMGSPNSLAACGAEPRDVLFRQALAESNTKIEALAMVLAECTGKSHSRQLVTEMFDLGRVRLSHFAMWRDDPQTHEFWRSYLRRHLAPGGAALEVASPVPAVTLDTVRALDREDLEARASVIDTLDGATVDEWRAVLRENEQACDAHAAVAVYARERLKASGER